MVRTVEIVSLSSGIIGEPFVAHEIALGLERLRRYGLEVRFSPHALRGIDYLRDHPEKRAEDLLHAFREESVDMILCAMGGDDTYRLLPYLFDNGELAAAVSDKIFLGFSDTTVNHFMLRKVGLKTFYGQSFLADVCELDREMLPYTRRYFEELITTGAIREIVPSPVWYENRTDFSPAALNTSPVSHPDRGFELLQGEPIFSGEILGGCIDTLFDFFDGTRYADMPAQCRKYGLFPTPEEWKGKILLLESSEETPSPEKYRQALEYFRDAGVFRSVRGILAGKPMDETWYAEYREALIETVADPRLPIVYNLNIGHAVPRCILPFGVEALVDAQAQRITFSGR